MPTLTWLEGQTVKLIEFVAKWSGLIAPTLALVLVSIIDSLVTFTVWLLVWFIVVAAATSNSPERRRDRLMVIFWWVVPRSGLATLGSWLMLKGEHCQYQFCQGWSPLWQYVGTSAVGGIMALVAAVTLLCIVIAFWEMYEDWSRLPRGATLKFLRRSSVALVAWPFWLGRAAWRAISPP